MGADGVEVPQQGHVQGGVGGANVGQDALGKGFGGAIGVGGGAHGEILGDGHSSRVAVDRGGGAEHKVLAAVAAHHVQDHQRAVQVVGVVLDGLGDALAHCLIGGKLDHSVNVRALGKDLLHILLAGHVSLIEAEVLAGDLLHPLQRGVAGVVEVVRHYDVIARVQQLDAGVAADVTSAAGDQNCHNKSPHSRGGAKGELCCRR